MSNWELDKEYDVVVYLKKDEFSTIHTKREMREYIKNRLRDSLGECQFLIDLDKVDNSWWSSTIGIPINFTNEHDKKEFSNIQNTIKNSLIEYETCKQTYVIPPRAYLVNSKLGKEYSKIRELIPTRESMEKQAFKDSLKYIKQYSLKKIKSLVGK